MRTAFSVFLGGMLLFLATCQRSNERSNGSQPVGAADLQDRVPQSVVYFSDAEQKLDLGELSFAAAQLNKGIVAYRIETGKTHGNVAKSANHAIDALTHLRKNLREGKSVSSHDLRLAIQNALAVEGIRFPLDEREEPQDLMVPVGGN